MNRVQHVHRLQPIPQPRLAFTFKPHVAKWRGDGWDQHRIDRAKAKRERKLNAPGRRMAVAS